MPRGNGEREGLRLGEIPIEVRATRGELAGEQVARPRARTGAWSGLLRALVYQREIEALGRRSVSST